MTLGILLYPIGPYHHERGQGQLALLQNRGEGPRSLTGAKMGGRLFREKVSLFLFLPQDVSTGCFHPAALCSRGISKTLLPGWAEIFAVLYFWKIADLCVFSLF